MGGGIPKPSDGYKEPLKYELESWKIGIAAVVSLLLIFAIGESLSVRYLLPNDPISNIAALIFGVAASLYLHESVHYIVTDFLDYEPEFVWPNRVKFGVDILATKPTVASLLAPQILSILYIAFIYIGVAPALEVILSFSLLLNLFAGAKDVSWAIRRLTWPRGTIFMIDDDEGYVAFEKD